MNKALVQICALCWLFLLRLIMHGTNVKLKQRFGNHCPRRRNTSALSCLCNSLLASSATGSGQQHFGTVPKHMKLCSCELYRKFTMCAVLINRRPQPVTTNQVALLELTDMKDISVSLIMSRFHMIPV
jgi:hypothetical protein